MDLVHPDAPGRRLRLAYCLNLHAAEDLEGLLASMGAVTLPLRERLAPGRPFGVGLYLPAALAAHLVGERGAADLARLDVFLREHALLPFTFNAFPAGGFQTDGLKAEVYRPAWDDPARLAFTRDVARAAAHLARGRDLPRISISTHPGGFGAWGRDEATLDAYARGLAAAARELEGLEEDLELTLSLEAEPRASAGDGAELEPFLARARAAAAPLLDGGEAAARRLLGTCLDACHAAVEFEDAPAALAHALAGGGRLGKLQFSSALAVEHPGRSPEARARLLALDEPRFLHQVTGRPAPSAAPLLRATDLPDLAAALQGPGAEAWLACDAWRCHFHVPVDLDRTLGLFTTRALADELLLAALADPRAFATSELHVEIETYTWSVLPDRGPGDLVDGLEREYRHVLGLCHAHGWLPA